MGQGGGTLGRSTPGTRRRPVRWIVVTVAVLAVVSVAVYWDLAIRNSAETGPTYGPALTPGQIRPVMASGNSNGPGGCAAPGGGATEFCFTFNMVEVAGLAFAREIAPDTSVEYLTTADLAFQLQGCDSHYVCSNATFANVTLTDGSALTIVATFSVGSGWVASAGSTLPIQILENQTFVLNVGTVNPSGDNLLVDEQDWGLSSSELA